MDDSSLVQPIVLLRDVKIYIHGILYSIILTFISCKDVNSNIYTIIRYDVAPDGWVIHDGANDYILVVWINGLHHLDQPQSRFEATTPTL